MNHRALYAARMTLHGLVVVATVAVAVGIGWGIANLAGAHGGAYAAVMAPTAIFVSLAISVGVRRPLRRWDSRLDAIAARLDERAVR